MTMTKIMIGILVLGGPVWIMANNKTSGQTNLTPGDSIAHTTNSQAKMQEVAENPNPNLRKQAFTVTPEVLQLDLSNDQTKVFGVIMDWDVGEAIATVVAFQTGDASVYISTGQLFIGGYAHDPITNSAKCFVDKAQQFLEMSAKANDHSLPDKDCVKFYLLTNKGTFVHQENVSNIKVHKTNWADLYEKGNQVITEYRLMTNKN